MSKRLTAVIALAAAATVLTGCDNGAFTTPTTNQLETPDYNYEIDTWGANSEVYEFTPKSHPGKFCVMLMLDNAQSMGLQCFDKPTK